MYEGFFGLQRKPFELVPNPDFLYLSRSHSRAGIYLDYAMKENPGFILLTGEVGSGKTTVIRKLLSTMGSDVRVSKIFNTKLDSEQLLATINDDFGLEIGGRTKVQLLRELYEFLIRQYAARCRSVLIVDEAQNLSVDSLEELRMLSNLETDDTKLLQIILVGQTELKKVLSVPELRQLRQRITIHCHLQPLTAEETCEYIFHRLEVAGNREAVDVAPEALALIHGYCGGIPRLINILCDFLLLSAFADQSRAVTAPLVDEVAADAQFQGQFFPRPVLPETVAEAKGSVSAPLQSAPRPHGAGEGKSVVSPAQVDEIYRRLDDFESSIREVCRNIVENEFRLDQMQPRHREEPERDIVLEFPAPHTLGPTLGRWFDGVKKRFTKF